MADTFLNFPKKTALTLSSSARLVGINGNETDEFSIPVLEFVNFVENNFNTTSSIDANSIVFSDDNGFLSGSIIVPTSISSSGQAGQSAYNDSYFYLCISASTWRRTAIGVF